MNSMHVQCTEKFFIEIHLEQILFESLGNTKHFNLGSSWRFAGETLKQVLILLYNKI